MFKKFIPPTLVLTIAITLLTIIGLNYETLSENSEANQNYFIKPILLSNLIVVEPNYGHFYNPNGEIKGDSSGEMLYSSLDDLQKEYEIKSTQMVRFERKGKMIPNLYVYVNSDSSDKTNRLSYEADNSAENS